MPDRELWSIAEVAAHLGVAVPSARGQLSRWGVAAVDYQRGDRGRAEGRYDADEVRAAAAARPGKGARTDLPRKAADVAPG